MRRKILANMLLLAFVTILFTALMISGVMYKEFYDRMKLEAANQAEYLAAAIDLENDRFLDTIRSSSNRITHIGADGTVLFDSETEAGRMENHRDRLEVESAISNGWGESVRVSTTLGNRTFYFARRLDDGSVIRVGSNVGSVFSTIRSAIPYIILITILVFGLSVLFANEQTRRIVTPINSIDLENPLYNDIYDELAPLLTRINKQNLLINSQMDEIRRRQEEFSTITQNMQDGLIVLDARSFVLYINQSAIRIFDVKEKDYLHKHILALSRSLSLRKAVGTATAGHRSEESMEVGERHYRIVGNPVVIGESVLGVTLLILDITERYAAEMMRRQFSANVSHELKTPLTSILGYAEIMQKGLVKQEDISRFSERIYQEANHMNTLVQDILKISRLDENSVDLPREQVDLLEIVNEVSERLKTEADKRGVVLRIEGQPSVLTGVKKILGDIVYNLCDNAIKYNRENGTVTLRIANHDMDVVLSVSDTGIGIPLEHQDRIFERFYRVDQSHFRETGGTGLGLSIVKHSALLHHAKIELDSKPGIGTTITLTFPK